MSKNKKQKWAHNRKRIVDALISNAHDNNINSLIENLSLLDKKEFENCGHILLFQSLKNNSKECAVYLIGKGVKYGGTAGDSGRVFLECEWNKIHDVYNTLIELGLSTTDKQVLVSRLLNPAKIEATPERIEYTFNLLKGGFFTAEDVRNVCKLLFKDKNQGKITMILRELTLNELGIE
jgi:hypothetical protein